MAGRTFTLDPRAIIRGKRLLGSSGYRHSLIPTLMDMMVKSQHAIPYDRVISNHYKLEDVNEAMEAAEWSGRSTSVTRAVLTP